MKLLHTADWHLGQKFLHNERETEHRLALDWLVQTIHDHKIELLIVAGDIFDISSPPNYARKLYYTFLTKLFGSTCKHIVIIGGNHDSPSMLNAPKELLESLNVHVIGSASEDINDDVIELKDKDGKLEAVIAAVPFLRDKDIRISITGESGKERVERIKEGIYNYYQKIGEACKSYKNEKVPIITTGHLYTSGAQASEKQNNIYIGNMDNIEASQFPTIFDYVALGHIHRAQDIDEKSHVRYSGSLIPLSFSEIQDRKSVSIITFDKKQKAVLEEIKIPAFRRLITIKGSYEAVQKRLDNLNAKILAEQTEETLTAWVEVIIETEQLIPQLDVLLNEYVKEMPLELLKIRTNHKHVSLKTAQILPNLDELKPIDVFRKKCESFGSVPEEMEALENSFLELIESME